MVWPNIKMKITLTLVSLMLVFLAPAVKTSFVSAANEPIYHPDGLVDRHRRVTCDLFGVSTPWGSLNHAACAAHCLVMGHGYRGGYCDGKGICNCRK